MTRVFLTGATGFVGARVAHQLVERGDEVALLLREGSDLRRVRSVIADCTPIYGDLTAPETFRDEVERFGPAAMIHVAWSGVKGRDRNDLLQLDNVSAAINLFRLALDVGCRRFVGLGSQAEYGPQTGIIREDSATHPTTLYGAAKLAVALLLERAAATHDASFAWLRLFSSYGPDDDPSWLISYLIRSLLAGQRPELTACEQVWDYIHVDDVASAIVASLDAEATGFFNLGSGEARPLREIVETVRDLIEPTLPIDFDAVPYRPDQVMHLQADISALSTATGWAPQIALRDGLAKTVKWYQDTQHA